MKVGDKMSLVATTNAASLGFSAHDWNWSISDSSVVRVEQGGGNESVLYGYLYALKTGRGYYYCQRRYWRNQI